MSKLEELEDAPEEPRGEEILVQRGVSRRLAQLVDRDLPENDFAAALLQLRRPFAPAAVKWKVQTEFWEGPDGGKRQGAVVVAYIDARLVIERLNLVWPWWDEDKQPAGQGAMRCVLLLKDPFDNSLVVTRKTDVGEGGDIKSMESDSLKRAAVHLGIGASIYALKSVKLYVGLGDSELRTEARNKKDRKTNQWKVAQVPIIDAKTLDWLSGRYQAWLDDRGERLFGPALDHGDEIDAQGLDTESPRAAAEAVGGEPVAEEQAVEQMTPMTDDRTKELRVLAEGIFQQVRKVKPRAMTPASFAARLLRASSTSHEEIEKLIGELEEIRDKAEAEST